MRLLDKLKGVEESGAGWRAFCPAHPDKNPSLSIDLSGDKILLRCMGGCPTATILARLQLNWSDLKLKEPVDLKRRAVALTEAQAIFRDLAYTELLTKLALSVPHRQALRNRGLSLADIEKAGYRTLSFPAKLKALEALSTKVGQDSSKVPGVIRDGAGLRLACKDGLLIPVRDILGRIVGLKVRYDRGGTRYTWLSSMDAPSGSPAHFSKLSREWGGEIWVTEGPLKADVVAGLSGGLPVIGLPGLPGEGDRSPLLDLLADLRPAQVVLAFDQDKAGETAARAFGATLQAGGLKVALAGWSGGHKGVDDAMAAGVSPSVWIYTPPTRGGSLTPT